MYQLCGLWAAAPEQRYLEEGCRELDGKRHPALQEDIYFAVSRERTECVGFFDQEQCAVVCPVDCCIADPNNRETEGILIQRARQLHPEETFSGSFPSRFRKG
jgi:hypothetical protein